MSIRSCLEKSRRSIRCVRASLAIVMAAAGLVCLDAGAQAGDGAAANVLGFSPDGRFFAFEQYGEEDGSGATYSQIAVIDIAKDQLVAEAPFVATTRATGIATAAPLLRRLDIRRIGIEVGHAPASRAQDVISPRDINPLMQAAVPELLLQPGASGARVSLRAFDLAVPHCRDLVVDGRPQGFALVLERPDMAPLVLHRDRTLPHSRGCPDRYGLAGAYALSIPGGRTALAILIQYFYFAFEGHNRRFIAVTAHVPGPDHPPR